MYSIVSYNTESIAFPSTLKILEALLDSAVKGFLWTDLKISVIRITLGWAVAIVLGTILGILVGYYTLLKPIDYINDFFRYLPVPAFVPLTLVWFGIGETSKIFLIFLGTVVQVISMVSSEIRRFPVEYMEVGYSIGMNRHKILLSIIFPGILPGLWDIYRITLGWAWTYLLIGEVVAANEGLGFRLVKSQRFLQIDTIYAYILIIGTIGILSDGVFRILKFYMFPYLQRR
ncbi:ABC transporter permease subunit [Hydrogenobacter sp. T-2]|uniref:ABC transporter permease n=1 Tax=Pampinifervens diazotrophicum TaxID=1632018 RepID=UPI002B260FE1|nr:ABC transporter permease subunit [Hydrogenobacter sp. T-2]WPM31274.1 ABC transporter permease subunit [Hydrogenobacter sp. T-2]